jgi:hypothetical protein
MRLSQDVLEVVGIAKHEALSFGPVYGVEFLVEI